MDSGNPHRVVIIGAGFAGLNVAKALKKADAAVTVIDRSNHHLFQPLLYQVATGGLAATDISASIRSLLRKQKNATVLLRDVTDVDVKAREVTAGGHRVPYDTLVVASGSSHSYFGNTGWAVNAPGLKTIEDALGIRARIIGAFEQAELAESDEERRRWLRFVIVGGGATGVELAGAIAEMAQTTLKDSFRNFRSTDAEVFLVEANSRLLKTYTPKSSEYAKKALERLQVGVALEELVTEVTPEGLTIKDRSGNETYLASRTVLWAAGVQASPLGRKIADATGAETDPAGRVIVNEDFTVPGHPEIFIVGDLAHYAPNTGTPLRGTADVAQSEGRYVGRLLRDRLRRKRAKPYRFRDLGVLAVIGRSAAVADLPWLKIRGLLAWWIWLIVHLVKLVDFQNKLTVLAQWGWSYITRNRSAMIITRRPLAGQMSTGPPESVEERDRIGAGERRGM
jgi:NADH dehydrogenase